MTSEGSYIQDNNFDALIWIQRLHPSFSRLINRHTQSLFHFALMWNMFEGVVCGASANKQQLQAVAERLADCGLTENQASRSFEAFVRARYWEGNALTAAFHSLHLRGEDEKASVSGMLSGAAVAPVDVVYALLLIVYRYRNNTFHGLKEIGEVLGSHELFDHSARFLAAVIEHWFECGQVSRGDC